jgi:hypothetical protein
MSDERADNSAEQALMSRIPIMAGGERKSAEKADYLGFRAVGFTVRQACQLVPVSEATLRRWRRDDPVFADVETNRLSELQSTASKDILQLEFTRNMRMAMRTDAKVLFKAATQLEALTNREFKHLQRIRSFYSPQDLMAMTKALTPEGEGPPDFASAVIKLVETRAETKTELEVRVAKGHNDSSEGVQPIIEGESEEVGMDRQPSSA